MPTSIQIDFYEFGIRIRQCRRIHQYFSPHDADDLAPSHGVEHPGPYGINNVRHSLCALGDAFQTIAMDAAMGETLQRTGRDLVRAASKQWREATCGRLTDRRQLQRLKRSIRFKLKDIEELACRAAISMTGEHAQTWMQLGAMLAKGTSGRAEKGWHWVLKPKSASQVKQLLAEIGVGIDELQPVIRDIAPHSTLLPFDPEIFRPWFQLELGLQRLRASVDKDQQRDRLGTTDSSQTGEPQDAGETPSFAGLSVENTVLRYKGAAVKPQPRAQICDALELLIHHHSESTHIERVQNRCKILDINSARKLMSDVRKYLGDVAIPLRLNCNRGRYRLVEEAESKILEQG